MRGEFKAPWGLLVLYFDPRFFTGRSVSLIRKRRQYSPRSAVDTSPHLKNK